MGEHTPAGQRPRRPRARRALVVAFALTVLAAPLAASATLQDDHSAPARLRAESRSRATQGGDRPRIEKPQAGIAKHGHLLKPGPLGKPTVLHLEKARSAVFDVRKLKSVVVKLERPEDGAPEGDAGADNGNASPTRAGTPIPSAPAIPAPAPDSSFDGLDFATWGAGHPPDENGDVGPNYYIQTINSSIGIFDKSNGNRVAAFTFNSFMSQGHFGNLCDTNNFGDPVVLYDSFEDRWFITDFAFSLDSSGNVNPQTVFQCFAVSKTGDPVNGGWNFYSILDPGGLGDYPKFGVWPDGIYMSANMFGYAAGGSYIAPHVWALNKAQMYAGASSPQVVDFTGPSADFTLLPANARLQTGAPPAGTPEYFTSTEEFLNGQTVYKFHVDWDKISTSTFTGPDVPLASTCWPAATPANASTTGNAADVLAIRAMAQTQYTNVGGAESLWVDHTVDRGEFSAANCGATTAANATPRWYQINVTGGTVAANDVQSTTWDPDGANTFYRFVPALAVDRVGDMAMGYTKSNSTTAPQIKYAGRLASDPINTFSQGEQTLINGTGSQTGNCGSSACIRWGDYSGMALDPNGCEFWETGEYFVNSGLNFNTRIGSFHFPSCTTVGNGTLSGTITDGTTPISGATVTLGNRTVTTNGSGVYSFTVPAGTYPTETAAKSGYGTASAATLVVPDGGTLTKDFTLSAAAQSSCITDNSQSAFQRGVPSGCDLVASPGNVQLKQNVAINQTNTTVTSTGFAVNSTSWAGQTFIPSVTGQVTQIDLDLFCSGCTGTTPNLTVAIRATSGGLPTGADLATATIPGFNSGSGGYFAANFASPPTLTAGTQYAIVFHAIANPSAGTYAYVCSCAGTGTVNSNPYANGLRVTSANSGSTWTQDTTVGGRDLGFNVWMNQGFPSSGTFTSSLKDANPAAGRTPTWTTLSFTANQPTGTSVKFQVAASNSQFGPFNFVGPDGTANTFFTTSGASLSQFNGSRYLKYKATLTTNNSAVTPSISSVQVCFVDTATTSATNLAADPATGSFGGTTTLSATLTSSSVGVPSETVNFTLNGSTVGSAVTNASGVATLPNVSLAGINAGSYPTGVGASFAGDASFDPSTGSNSLMVSKADQSITVTTHAPSSAVYNTGFSVAATGGASGNPVTFSSADSCSNTGATFTMTSGTGACSVKYDQAGDNNYNAAPQVTETVTAGKADQSINVTTHAPSSAVYNTSFAVAANAPGGDVSYSSAGACSNSGATFTMSSGTGNCTVSYDQNGNANFNPAAEVSESVTAEKADQTITVTQHAPASAAYATSFDVSASVPGGPVDYSSGGSCTNGDATFTVTSGTGVCIVKYDRAGDDDHNPAPQVTETVNAQKADQTITITTHAPSTAVYATSFTVAAYAAGGLVTFSSGGACINFGASFTMLSGTGTCAVEYDQLGNDNYNAAPEVTETVTAQKADQTIKVTTDAPASAVYGGSFGVAASDGDSGNAVTFSGGGSCSNSGSTFTMTSGTGICSVEYDEAGDDNYNPAPQVVESTTAGPASLAITANDRTKVQGTTLDLGTTAFSTGGLVGADGIASVTLTSAGAAANAAAGTYPIVPSAAVAAAGTDLGNYAITYANGTLTVTPATNNGPTVKITTPPEGATYKQDMTVRAAYKCVAVNRVAVASCAGTVPSGSPIDTSAIGQHSFTVTGTDVHGGTTVMTTHYTVIYTWSGFFSVANASTSQLNVVRAGSAVAVLFGLNGNRGLNVLAAGSPDSVAVPCPNWQLRMIRPATGTSAGLAYSTTTNRYTYGWQTDPAWAGTCRQFSLATNDGTAPHAAVFKFTS